MSAIEWQESREIQPEAASLDEFCARNHIARDEIDPAGSPLAFVEHEALASLYDYLSHDPRREHGGVLAGFPFVDPESGRHYVCVLKAIPALQSEGSSVHMQFTAASWEHIAGIIDEENLPGLAVVGWFHSHPGLGVFMSGTDQDTQTAFFNHPWSLAVVVDPQSQRSGWFSGPDSQPLGGELIIPYRQGQTAATRLPDAEAKDETPEETGGHGGRLEIPGRYRWLLPLAGLILILASTLILVRHLRT
jgi:proteasome lid subunit RPN8/RPN11